MQGLIVAGLASISLTVSAAGAPAELEWSAHYANAKAEAAAKQRPLLVVLEDSSNPAGQFKADELATQGQQVELLKKYELCRMDVNTAYGKKVAEAFNATEFPLTVVTDRTANFITYRADGALDTEQWQSMLAVQISKPVRVETAKVVTGYPNGTTAQPASQYPAAYPAYTPSQSVPSNCPNCVRNRQQYYYYQ